jgi:hypothetical protein
VDCCVKRLVTSVPCRAPRGRCAVIWTKKTLQRRGLIIRGLTTTGAEFATAFLQRRQAEPALRPISMSGMMIY